MTRAEQKAKTRARLLRSAQKLFRNQGWPAVGIRDIAREAGVSTGAVFGHWPSKEALWREAMGYDWPDPLAFAGLMRKLSARPTSVGALAEMNIAAKAFMLAYAGENHGHPIWQGPEEEIAP